MASDGTPTHCTAMQVPSLTTAHPIQAATSGLGRSTLTAAYMPDEQRFAAIGITETAILIVSKTHLDTLL